MRSVRCLIGSGRCQYRTPCPVVITGIPGVGGAGHGGGCFTGGGRFACGVASLDAIGISDATGHIGVGAGGHVGCQAGNDRKPSR